MQEDLFEQQERLNRQEKDELITIVMILGILFFELILMYMSITAPRI